MKSTSKILGSTFVVSLVVLLLISVSNAFEIAKLTSKIQSAPIVSYSSYKPKLAASVFTPVTTGFEDFSTTNTLPLLPVGTIDGQSGWSVRDDCDGVQKIYTPLVSYDEQIVDIDGNNVWRLSNALTTTSYRAQPFSPATDSAAGETGACTWNKRGSVPPMTNSACQSTPLTCGRTAGTDKFYGTFKFKSATGAAQPGLAVVVSPSAKQSTLRYSYVQIKDNGTGLDLYFVETLLSGTFSSSIPLATGLSYTDWHTIQIDMKFYDGLNGDGTGNDCVGIYVDGNLVNTGTTWETYYKSAEPVGGSPKPRAVDSLLFRVSSAAAGTLGNGLYFDDVFLTTNVNDIPTNLTCTQTAPLCAPTNNSVETCDGIDNNCDGTVDEGTAGTPTTCGVGICASNGQTTCIAGNYDDTCTPKAPQNEVCNGIDDNCDGIIDNVDADSDGVNDCGIDKCLGTTKDTLSETLRPNNHVFNGKYTDRFTTNVGSTKSPAYAASYSIEATKGCSCAQILNAKPGQDMGQLNYGCSKGTMDNWIKSI